MVIVAMLVKWTLMTQHFLHKYNYILVLSLIIHQILLNTEIPQFVVKVDELEMRFPSIVITRMEARTVTE